MLNCIKENKPLYTYLDLSLCPKGAPPPPRTPGEHPEWCFLLCWTRTAWGSWCHRCPFHPRPSGTEGQCHCCSPHCHLAGEMERVNSWKPSSTGKAHLPTVTAWHLLAACTLCTESQTNRLSGPTNSTPRNSSRGSNARAANDLGPQKSAQVPVACTCGQLWATINKFPQTTEQNRRENKILLEKN